MGEFVHTLLRQPLFVVELLFLFGLPFALLGKRDHARPGVPSLVRVGGGCGGRGRVRHRGDVVRGSSHHPSASAVRSSTASGVDVDVGLGRIDVAHFEGLCRPRPDGDPGRWTSKNSPSTHSGEQEQEERGRGLNAPSPLLLDASRRRTPPLRGWWRPSCLPEPPRSTSPRRCPALRPPAVGRTLSLARIPYLRTSKTHALGWLPFVGSSS